jgi:dTMP kinase
MAAGKTHPRATATSPSSPDSTSAAICFKIAPMSRLPFITFEGSEGCGKSTQVQRLADRLTKAGIPLFLTREPGGTPIGEKIRDLIQFDPASAAMTPETELLLFEASRSQLVREKIQPALDRGMVVISDRFADSTTVYQGVARRLDQEMVRHLHTLAVGSCWPDLTFVLDVDVATARARMLRRVRPASTPDRMEQEPLAFYEAVCAAYRELAEREPYRVQLIDGTRPVEEIEEEIWETIAARFGNFARLLEAPRPSGRA